MQGVSILLLLQTHHFRGCHDRVSALNKYWLPCCAAVLQCCSHCVGTLTNIHVQNCFMAMQCEHGCTCQVPNGVVAGAAHKVPTQLTKSSHSHPHLVKGPQSHPCTTHNPCSATIVRLCVNKSCLSCLLQQGQACGSSLVHAHGHACWSCMKKCQHVSRCNQVNPRKAMHVY